ncbi:MAG: histidine--tRNA ligase [Planctomycetes bacterium]|nr:histidine--tRNA ligase [Planctomycetota bacterium]
MAKFQAPKGTRDFYPAEMAWRRHLEGIWRAVSVRNGFEEVDGPIFETLDLYKVKSGDGIVSELFHFKRTGGETMYALRPEFTPTLARMVAAKANALPKPIKWFCVPNLCRAERPQKGRLREFLQWNIDMLGLDTPAADAEVIFTAVDLLRALGLEPRHVKVKISHRDVVRRILLRLGVREDKVVDAFVLLDRREKMLPDEFTKAAGELGLDASTIERFNQVARMRVASDAAWGEIASQFGIPDKDLEDLAALHAQLRAFGIAEWCEYDLGIVRGLAYYTGTVFEIHETSGALRAVAGGGRYDKLIELFDGPPTPAVGFGMGDVVLRHVLEDKGLIPADVAPPVDVFVMTADEAARERVTPLVSELRGAGMHARFSYKTTTNVGKLLKDAAACRAKFAVIVDAKTLDSGEVSVKDMASGDQTTVRRGDLISFLNR